MFPEINPEWHFFATSHGKGAVDGVGGTVKHAVSTAVISRQAALPHHCSCNSTADEVRTEPGMLRPGKAAGSDGVCPRLLKDCAAQLGRLDDLHDYRLVGPDITHHEDPGASASLPTETPCSLRTRNTLEWTMLSSTCSNGPTLTWMSQVVM
ncbi:hypothetical protein SKAU_G00212420 [Synaphobranchus kaupii]|uniref:Uncharacterized protein n=1 Tax=Synaphobranchus kaupii TaxID=118154 RepID=A0A9Q1F9B8_SYNKA|nr:hypothetical protein SKAU_G00212420 [Synaphobranchus kaupii]